MHKLREIHFCELRDPRLVRGFLSANYSDDLQHAMGLQAEASGTQKSPSLASEKAMY
jgi:hypothetical protein